MDQRRLDQLQVLSRALLNLNALVFFVYGICFALFPGLMSVWVVDVKAEGASMLTDMRATYGGVQIALGVLFYSYAKTDIKAGLKILMMVMIGMAATRSIGFFVDGYQNILMFVYLLAEVLVAFWARHLLKQYEQYEQFEGVQT